MSQSENSSRWWEFYAVRYGMGTVVGGVIFFFLCNTNPALKPMLFGAEAGKIDGHLIALFAGYGLAYCYIASAPILVFHAGRFLIDQGAKASLRRIMVLFVPPAIVTLIFFFFLIFFFTRIPTGQTPYFSLVFALAAIVLWLQCLAIYLMLSRTKELFKFYENLASKRESAKGGIVDSYKHLREHGNSFFIVILEAVLAIILFTAGNFVAAAKIAVPPTTLYICIIFAWILPAALVWLVGTFIERQFCDA